MQRENGEHAVRTWGCPARGLTPPAKVSDDEGFRSLGEAAHRTMGVAQTGTCPFARLYRMTPYALAIFRALRLAERGIPVERSLGRLHLLPGDLRALDAFETARLEVQESDLEEIRRQHPPDKQGRP